MAGIIGNGVSLRGLYSEDFAFTWNLTGLATQVLASAAVGKVMSQDTTAANSAKLAVADEAILGVLGSAEVRSLEGITVGTLYHAGAFSVPYTGAVAIGDAVCGSATPGAVKTATAAIAAGVSRKSARVVEIDAPANTCVILFV